MAICSFPVLNHFPHEINKVIFSELNYKELVVCDLVCKSWNKNLNSDANFKIFRTKLNETRALKVFENIPKRLILAVGIKNLCLIPEYNPKNYAKYSIFRASSSDQVAAAKPFSFNSNSILFKTLIDAGKLQAKFENAAQPTIFEFKFYTDVGERLQPTDPNPERVTIIIHGKERMSCRLDLSYPTMLETLIKTKKLCIPAHYFVPLPYWHDNLPFNLAFALCASDQTEECVLF